MASHRSSLHPPVFPSQISAYSSLAGALTAVKAPRFLKPRRRHVPQYKCKMPPCCGPICPPILFDHFGAKDQGVSIHDFIALSTNALAKEVIGAHDQIFSNLNIYQLTLRVLWKGYECLNWARSIPVSPAISRAQLGATIAMQFWNFIEDAQKHETLHLEWKVGPNAIKFDQIVLLGLYHIYNDTWQADVAVDFPL